MDKINNGILISILKKMLEIRRFEEKSIQLYQMGKLYGQLHPYLGEEAIAAGACAALNDNDYVLSTHRGHGHCIARGADINKMMAELYGKSTGLCNGRGGSMHIADPQLSILGANGIVGGGIPISVGVGLGSKLKNDKRVTVCFFGDGAANNGVFHESLNMASLFKLPVIYICENNLYAVSTNVKKSTSVQNISDRSTGYNMPGYKIDGNDPVGVYMAVKKAVEHSRKGKGPSLIEAKTYRFTGHHLNDAEAYRDKEEVKNFRKTKDPVKNYVSKLLQEKIITNNELKKIEDEIIEKLQNAVDFAENSPEPRLDEFLNNIV